ncbi:MAG: NRDE family protein [Deltaproteobacteria bacterium]|nr:NRDE family protein [Deltaproteobacteria bacterium]
MCLLIALSRCHPAGPLVVAANRDEWLERPASATAVLRERGPRVVGGRDELAGGTWLAVNQHGVIAGLTNQPSPIRDPSLRSRGELPLAFTRHTSARAAVDDADARLRPADFGPAWLLVGDPDALFLVDMTGGERPGITELPPGVHVLENRAWGARSAKVAAVRERLTDLANLDESELHARLAEVLRSHQVPDGPADDSGVPGFTRPRETEANCVHAGPYGTRSSSIAVSGIGAVRLWTSDGPPCTHPLLDRSALFVEG